MRDYTYKDLNLILQMGANGFGIDDVSYDNGLAVIQLSRWERGASNVVEATIIQTQEGFKISKLDLPENEVPEDKDDSKPIQFSGDLTLQDDDEGGDESKISQG